MDGAILQALRTARLRPTLSRQAVLLTRRWGQHRRTFYRSPQDPGEDGQAPVLRLICPLRQCCVELRDDELLARLVEAALQQGVDLHGRSLSISAEPERLQAP